MQSKNLMIIEDDLLWYTYMLECLENTPYRITGCNHKEQVLSTITSVKPDLIISDIVLEDQSIFDFINPVKIDVPILFMTSSNDETFFEEASKFKKKQYLVKPFHKYSLLSSISSLLGEPLQENEKSIIVKDVSNTKLSLKESEIIYVQSKLNYCIIFTRQKQFAIKSSIDAIHKLFEENFIRTHKSFIINKNYIDKIFVSKNFIQCASYQIPIGRFYKKQFID